MRKFLASLVCSLGVAATAVAAAPTAQASIPRGVSVPGQYYYVTPCAGKLIRSYPLHNELNETRGVTRVYYSGSLGGVVCAMTLDLASGKHGMTVSVRKYSLSYQGSDNGIYNTYAGGIAVPRSNGRCFSVHGSVNYGSNRTLQFSGGGSFCKPGSL